MTERTANYQRAELAAEKMLKENFIIEPPVDVLEIARNTGLYVLEGSFDRYSDVAGYLDMNSGRIVVNEAEPSNRQAFTVAHEIGHYVLHLRELKDNPELGIVYRRAIAGEKNPIEQEANCFAANLLVPKKFLARYLGQDRTRIAEIFGVSEEVIGYRLKSFGITQ